MFGPGRVKGSPIPGLRRQRRSGARRQSDFGRIDISTAGMISARTKAALAAAKRRAVKLGGDRGARLTAKARAAGRAAGQERARSRAMDLAPTIKELQEAGCESLRAIAAGLEERGIPAARGGKWSAVQVSRLLEAARSPFEASAVAAVA